MPVFKRTYKQPIGITAKVDLAEQDIVDGHRPQASERSQAVERVCQNETAQLQ
jgi:hypothetical protein